MSSVATAAGIGGSSAAAAVGLDPYRSKVQLWLELTGRVEQPDVGEAAYWGTQLEPILAAELERREGIVTVPARECIHLGEHAVGMYEGRVEVRWPTIERKAYTSEHPATSYRRFQVSG